MKNTTFITFLTIGLFLSAFSFRKELFVENRSFHKVNESYNYTLDINYPKVYNFEENIDYAINLSVQAIMVDAISDFQKKAARIQPPTEDIEEANSLNFNYEILAQENNIFSVKFIKKTKYINSNGSYELVRTFNYNLDKGHRITLKKIFLPDDFEAELMEIVNKKIRGGKLNSTAFLKDFTLTKEYLLFHLHNVNGIPSHRQKETIQVSWAEIKTLINQDELEGLISLK